MNHAELIQKYQRLPPDKQAEVADFIEFLSARHQVPAEAAGPTEWTDAEFAELAMGQALRGMEDEPDLYTRDDLKEIWS
jgi:hypothetical protein